MSGLWVLGSGFSENKVSKQNSNMTKIAIIGLGYVGLPLAVAFAEKYPVIGFDINQGRVDQLKGGHDFTLEVSDELLKSVVNDAPKELGLLCTTDLSQIKDCNYFIVTVPTPTDKHNRPDLTPLLKASEMLGKIIKKGDIVIYESTVYPGCTEEDCVPVLEKYSGSIKNNPIL